MPCRQDIGSASHGGCTLTKIITRTVGISAISSDPTSGDITTHPCSTSLPGSWRSGQRAVRTLEAAGILPEHIFASEVMPSNRPIAGRRQAHQEWFTRAVQKLSDADLVFIDPDNGLQPDGFSHGSAKAGKSVLINELLELARPGRCLIVYHHQTRRTGGHHSEIEHWAERLRATGFATVDALRARPYSPRVYFLLNAPLDIRQRAERLEGHWQGLITWRPGAGADGHRVLRVTVRMRSGVANDADSQTGWIGHIGARGT